MLLRLAGATIQVANLVNYKEDGDNLSYISLQGKDS